ncbi:HNH endonuclease [Streptomyces sp. HUAS TT7]|uniref:HNH endonuclease n=1 Tax=Streptomyces sp. HUAS TT7 TaxID=3447507 RepID=UPI003F6553D7
MNRAKAIAANPQCSRCGSTRDLTGDHIIPLSKGGTSALSNIAVLCRRCNSSKGNRA